MESTTKLREKIENYLDPMILSLVVGDAFTHRELVTCITAEGIDYPGVRTKSVSREQLAQDLAIEAFQHDDVLGRLVPKLHLACQREIAAVMGMDLTELKRRTKTLDEVLLLGRPGAVIGACIVDEREEVARRVAVIVKNAWSWADDALDAVAAGKTDPGSRPALSAKTQKELVNRFEKERAEKEKEFADLRKLAEGYDVHGAAAACIPKTRPPLSGTAHATTIRALVCIYQGHFISREMTITYFC